MYLDGGMGGRRVATYFFAFFSIIYILGLVCYKCTHVPSTSMPILSATQGRYCRQPQEADSVGNREIQRYVAIHQPV